MTPQEKATAILAALQVRWDTAAAATGGPWTYSDDMLDCNSGVLLTANVTRNAWDVASCYGGPLPGTPEERERQAQHNAAHIAAHDPKWVRRDVEDKQARVERALRALRLAPTHGDALADLDGLYAVEVER